MTAGGQRLAWIDAAKGLGILLVVFGHTWRGCWDAGLFENVPAPLFQAVDMRIYAFHMPLFFMISGLFLISSMTRRSPGRFVTNDLVRIVYPMVLWSYLFSLGKLLAGGSANTPMELAEFQILPIPGQWQFWFLWALLVLHIGMLALRPLLLSERLGHLTLWALLAAGLALQYIPLPPALLYWTNNAPSFLPYLVIGMILGHHNLLRPLPAPAGAAALGIFCLTLTFVPQLAAAGMPQVLTTVILCLSALGALSWLYGALPTAGRALAFLGAASMIIYLSHTFFAAGLWIGLLSLGLTSLPLHLVCGTLVGLALPFVVKALAGMSGRPAAFGV